MDGKIEQHMCNNFSMKILENTLSWTEVFEWYSHFKDGQVPDEDDDSPAQSSTSKMLENDQKF
jgi:hypothetical protein